MEVKEAARMAKNYIVDLFGDEAIADVGFEEVDFDQESNAWKITIGFHRPWDHRNKLLTALGDQYPSRSYKVVRIDNAGGRVISVTDRVLPAITE